MAGNEWVRLTKKFVEKRFQDFPHYSFNHWSVMYNHSIKVQEIALQIAKEIKCNKNVLALSALLHDIGKTYETSFDVLLKNHETFNLAVSEDFLQTLGLTEGDYKKICDIISNKEVSVESKILKDADALALYFDKTLSMLYIEWAVEKGYTDEIARKISKFDRLYFDVSKKLAEPKFEKMKRDWEKYMDGHKK